MASRIDSLTPHCYSVSDFLGFGQHYGIDYRFPMLRSLPGQALARHPVVCGKVEELELRNGIRLTRSDIDVLQHYESTSLLASPLFIVIVLEGEIRVRLGSDERRLGKGTAISTQFDDCLALNVLQPAGQHLETLALSLNAEALREQGTAALLQHLPNASTAWLHEWRMPGYLLAALEDALRGQWASSQRRMMLEGLALQLLAHGLAVARPSSCQGRLSPRERQRLEAVRQALHDDPAREHSLQSLADLAAMSASSLRSKFHAAFGQSVFDYLRDRRLALARDYLLRGYSVQQAAHVVGYRHATNFATAFRRRYGIAPSSLR